MSNSLDPDQAQQNVGPALGPNCLQKASADDTSRLKMVYLGNVYYCRECVNPHPADVFFFVQKTASAYYVCCMYSNALQTNFIMEANTKNPDQTSLKGGV